MAVGGGVRVEGLNTLVRDLERLGVEVDDLKAAFGAIAAEGAQKAAQFAPRRTGRLAASVRGNRAKNKAVVTAGKASIAYAVVINYGSPKRHIAASQFMQRADEAMRPIALERIEAAISTAIRKTGLQ
jgi:phage gpG-like protein